MIGVTVSHTSLQEVTVTVDVKVDSNCANGVSTVIELLQVDTVAGVTVSYHSLQ